MTYPNKEAAKKACELYRERVNAISDELGVWEESSDSCCDVNACADYLDENGNLKTFTLY